MDNLSTVFRKLHPSAKISSPKPLTITLQSVDDFHPDKLLGQIPGAEQMLSLRRRLQNASTFEKAKAELTQLGTTAAIDQDITNEVDQEPASTRQDDVSDFSSLLAAGTSAPGDRPSAPARSAVDSLVGDIVRQHVVPALGEQQSTLITAVDDALSELVRSVLHAPEFQSLESIWLGVDSVVTEIYDDAPIEVFIYDMNPASINDPSILDQLQKAITPAATDNRWSLFVVADYFGAAPDDLACLEQWSSLAQASGAALLAGAAPALAGVESFAATPQDHIALPDKISELWNNFRDSPSASNVGLAAPRILQRQPYGKGSDEIDTFNFAELKPRPSHESFLWGNPAYAITRSIVEAFQVEGWKFAQFMQQDIPDLPLAIYNDGTGQSIKPAGECLLSEKHAHEMIELGLIPVLSYRDRNAAKWLQFRSVGQGAGTPAGLGT